MSCIEKCRGTGPRPRVTYQEAREHDNLKEGRATKRRRRDGPSSQAPMVSTKGTYLGGPSPGDRFQYTLRLWKWTLLKGPQVLSPLMRLLRLGPLVPCFNHRKWDWPRRNKNLRSATVKEANLTNNLGAQLVSARSLLWKVWRINETLKALRLFYLSSSTCNLFNSCIEKCNIFHWSGQCTLWLAQVPPTGTQQVSRSQRTCQVEKKRIQDKKKNWRYDPAAVPYNRKSQSK